jgi:hypothetical protein
MIVTILIIIGSILLWIACGFYAFIWDAKLTNRSEFDSPAKGELAVMLILGMVALAIVAYMWSIDKFNNFMSNLLKKNSSK